jgi:hypothetical protein
MATRKSTTVSSRGPRTRRGAKVSLKAKLSAPIDKLLAYWIDLSKRPTLTQRDFRTFINKTEETLQYFVDYYGWYRGKQIEQDKFFRRPYSLVWWQKQILEKELESKELSDQHYALMKEYATKFIPRIKKCFGRRLALSYINKNTTSRC